MDHLLTQSPIDLKRVTAIAPLGDLDPPDHTLPVRHMYWYTGDPQNPPAQPADVVSPGNITIFEVEKVEYGNRDYQTDYSIRFALCEDVTGYIYHVHQLDEAVLAQIGTFEFVESYRTATESVTVHRFLGDIPLSPNDRIGTVSYYGTLDLGMDDRHVENTVLNRKWFGHRRHAVNPLDYFTVSARKAIEKKVGSWDGKRRRVVEPIGGTASYDLPGTAQGFWIVDNFDPERFPESQSVALVWGMVNPNMEAISIENIGSVLDRRVLYFNPLNEGRINRPFSSVTPDGVTYEYKTEGGNFQLTMTDVNRIALHFPSEIASDGIDQAVIRLKR